MAPRRSNRISTPPPKSTSSSPKQIIASPRNLMPKFFYTGPLPVISNVVCGTNLNCRIDCKTLALHMYNTEYLPKRFPACIVRKRDPKATAIISATGRMQIVGAGSIADAKLAARKFERTMRKQGFGPEQKMDDITVQNLVARVDAKFPIHPDGLALKHHAAGARYEPEQFPGLVYKMQDPRVCFVIFSQGKVNLMGAKTQEDLDAAMMKMWPCLVEHRK